MDTDRLLRFALVGALVLCACASPKIKSQHAADADFSKLRTFQWLEGVQERTGALRMGPEAVDGMIREVVERELAQRGFTAAPSGTPDFFVRYHAAVGGEMKVSAVMRDKGGSTRSLPVRHSEGTLVLDVLEPAGERIIWQASAQAEINRYLKREQRRENLTAIVHSMLESFPPR